MDRQSTNHAPKRFNPATIWTDTERKFHIDHVYDVDDGGEGKEDDCGDAAEFDREQNGSIPSAQLIDNECNGRHLEAKTDEGEQEDGRPYHKIKRLVIPHDDSLYLTTVPPHKFTLLY